MVGWMDRYAELSQDEFVQEVNQRIDAANDISQVFRVIEKVIDQLTVKTLSYILYPNHTVRFDYCRSLDSSCPPVRRPGPQDRERR